MEKREKWQKEEEERKQKLAASRNYTDQRMDYERRKEDLDRYKVVQAAKDKRRSYYLPSLIVSALRLVFDVGLPLVVGGYAIRLLMFP